MKNKPIHLIFLLFGLAVIVVASLTAESWRDLFGTVVFMSVCVPIATIVYDFIAELADKDFNFVGALRYVTHEYTRFLILLQWLLIALVFGAVFRNLGVLSFGWLDALYHTKPYAYAVIMIVSRAMYYQALTLSHVALRNKLEDLAWYSCDKVQGMWTFVSSKNSVLYTLEVLVNFVISAALGEILLDFVTLTLPIFIRA